MEDREDAGAARTAGRLAWDGAKALAMAVGAVVVAVALALWRFLVFVVKLALIRM